MVGTIITPILQVGKLRCREMNLSKATHSGASKIPTQAYQSPCSRQECHLLGLLFGLLFVCFCVCFLPLTSTLSALAHKAVRERASADVLSIIPIVPAYSLLAVPQM